MKRIFIAAVAFCFAASLQAQEAVSAKPGAVFGNLSDKEMKPVSVNDLEKKIGDTKYEGQVKGKVVEVCQEMGCWAKIERADGSTIMLKVKDHEFAMPKDIVGKIVIADGTAEITETSVSMLKHYAEDAGKSKEEIEKIKDPKKEVVMSLKGVKVVE